MTIATVVHATLRRAAVAGLLALPAVADAQTSQPTFQLPGSADPSRVPERFPAPPPARGAPPAPTIESEPQTPPDQAEALRFVLTSVTVAGATMYGADALARVWADRIDQEITLADVYGFADALTARYRNDGFVLSQVVVPPQRIRDGAVTLQAIEGFVDEIVIEGDTDRADLLRDYAAPVIAERPLRVGTIERAVLMMQDLPGITVRSVLRPSETPGAALLVIHLEHKPIEGFVTMDNRGSRYLGPFEASLGVRLNSPLGLQDQTTVRLITTPASFDELRAYDIGEVVPVGPWGTLLSMQWNESFSRPGYTLRQFDVRSHATTFTLGASHPVVRQRNSNLALTGSLGAIDVETRLFGNAALLSLDRVRPLRVGFAYDLVDGWRGVSQVTFRISRGLPILDATPETSTTVSRTNGVSDFTKIQLDATRRQALGGPWAVQASVAGQYAFDRLLAVEEFGIGGAQYLRAYDPSELTGSNGVAGRFELQYGLPAFGPLGGLQLYGFGEAGAVWNRDGLGGRSQTATDIGGGLRFAIGEFTTGTVELGVPLGRGVSAFGGDNDPRVFFSLIARF